MSTVILCKQATSPAEVAWVRRAEERSQKTANHCHLDTYDAGRDNNDAARCTSQVR